MSFLKRLFAGHSPGGTASPHSHPATQFAGSGPMAQQNAGRREMLRLVLRDTLNRTGIPTSWIGADLLAAVSRGRDPGIHVRLLLKHWDPRLMLHGVAFEKAFRKRLLAMEPEADRWLLGFSWQFSLASNSSCPPLPHPGIWTSDLPAADGGAVDQDLIPTGPADLLGGSIVISGPAASPESSAARPAAAAAIRTRQPGGDARPEAEAKADLERLFAVRDEDLKRARSQPATAPKFAPTEPASLNALSPADAQKAFAKTDIFRRPERPIAPTPRPAKH